MLKHDCSLAQPLVCRLGYVGHQLRWVEAVLALCLEFVLVLLWCVELGVEEYTRGVLRSEIHCRASTSSGGLEIVFNQQ